MWTGNHISWDIASPLSCPKSIRRVANNIYLECTRQKSSITSVQPGINSTHCKNMTKYTCNLVRSKCIPKKSNKNTKKLYIKLTWKDSPSTLIAFSIKNTQTLPRWHTFVHRRRLAQSRATPHAHNQSAFAPKTSGQTKEAHWFTAWNTPYSNSISTDSQF